MKQYFITLIKLICENHSRRQPPFDSRTPLASLMSRLYKFIIQLFACEMLPFNIWAKQCGTKSGDESNGSILQVLSSTREVGGEELNQEMVQYSRFFHPLEK